MDLSQDSIRFEDNEIRIACGYSFSQKSQLSTKGNSDKDQENDSMCSVEPNYIKAIQWAYSQHKIDLAFQYVQKLEKQNQEKAIILSDQELHLINMIKMEMKDLSYFEEKVHQKGWEVRTQKKNITVSTKYEGESVGVLVEAQLDIQIEKFLTVMIETDLMKRIMPFMKESKTLKKLGRNNQIGHCLNDFPILTNRQAFFQGIGYDRMEHNKTIFLYSRTLHDRPDLQKLFNFHVKPTPKAIQLDYHYFVLEYRPTSPSFGTIKLAINVDLKISLPMFILAAGSESFGLDFYKNVLKIARNFEGSDWQKKAEENPGFFQFVKRRIKEEFTDKYI